LGKLATPAALDRLTGIARQGKDSVAHAALLQVTELDAARGAKLATELARSDNPSARLAAVYAAGNLPGPAAAQIVLNAAKSPDANLAEAALSELSALPSDVAANALTALLQNTHVPNETRVRAAQALAGFGGEVAQKHAALIAQFPEESAAE
jgi:HEAT repeat protein